MDLEQENDRLALLEPLAKEIGLGVRRPECKTKRNATLDFMYPSHSEPLPFPCLPDLKEDEMRTVFEKLCPGKATVPVTPPRFYHISKTGIRTNHKTCVGLFNTLWRP